MKKKPKIFYNPIEGSAPLAIYWQPGPYGDASEASSGNGVFWQSAGGELLGVQFDDVSSENDEQTLVISRSLQVSVSVKKGKISCKVCDKRSAA